jgi:mannose-6-phosphate isomerase class I
MCPHFQVDDLKLIETYKDFTNGSSFHLLSAPDNPVVIKANNFETELHSGRTCLLPASTGSYTITPLEKSATVLKTHI